MFRKLLISPMYQGIYFTLFFAMISINRRHNIDTEYIFFLTCLKRSRQNYLFVTKYFVYALYTYTIKLLIHLLVHVYTCANVFRLIHKKMC